MTDGDLLFKAILDNPEDDTLRLVYADWLQEQGQDDRAEFIRSFFPKEVHWKIMTFNSDYPEWRPECWACSGRCVQDAPMLVQRPNGQIAPLCLHCNDGRIGRFYRGLLVLEVPTLETVVGRVKCEYCDDGRWVTPSHSGECRVCDGSGHTGEWRLTEWAKGLRQWPVTEVWVGDSDRYLRVSGGGGVWWADDKVYDHDALPAFLCPMAEYRSVEEATKALAQAVAKAIRG